MGPRSSFGQSARFLEAADPVLARIIARIGPYRFETETEGTHFAALVRSIVYQQLNGKAASTIHGRVEALFGGPPAPAAVLAAADERLRAAGLSRQKISYMKDLAEKAGPLAIERLHELPDAEVIEALREVKGIGLWTAQVFLMFRLGRPDVLPATDFGIRRAIMLAYKLRAMPTPAKVEKIGKKWRPHASAAAWYLWRSLDLENGDGTCHVPKGATPADVTVDLEPAGSLRVNVVSSIGEPVARVRVSIMRNQSSTDASGARRFTELKPGSYGVWLGHWSLYVPPDTTVEVKAGEEAQATLTYDAAKAAR